MVLARESREHVYLQVFLVSRWKQLQSSTGLGLFLLEPQPLQARADVSSVYGVGLAGACGVSMKKMSSFLGFQMRAMITLQQSMKINLFSRMRSEGFPFIVGGLGVGPLFAASWSARRFRVVFASLIPCL